MLSEGGELVKNPEDADLSVIGTCVVIKHTQVLGCNFSAAHSISSEVDAYVVVSTGKFHAVKQIDDILKILLSMGKKVSRIKVRVPRLP